MDSIGVGTIAVGAILNLVMVGAVCTRIRRAKALQGLGYPAAAVQLMWDDREVRAAMKRAGTPYEAQRSKSSVVLGAHMGDDLWLRAWGAAGALMFAGSALGRELCVDPYGRGRGRACTVCSASRRPKLAS